MTWTKKLPTENGWYGVKYRGHQTCGLVYADQETGWIHLFLLQTDSVFTEEEDDLWFSEKLLDEVDMERGEQL